MGSKKQKKACAYLSLSGASGTGCKKVWLFSILTTHGVSKSISAKKEKMALHYLDAYM